VLIGATPEGKKELVGFQTGVRERAQNCRERPSAHVKGENQLPKVVRGVSFQNGIEITEMPAHHAA
jgi:hypothetical protein